MKNKIDAVVRFWKEYAPETAKRSLIIFLTVGLFGSIIVFALTPSES